MGPAATGGHGEVKKAWVDANVVLRFLLRDDERLYAKAAKC